MKPFLLSLTRVIQLLIINAFCLVTAMAQSPVNDNWFELGDASYSCELYSIAFATNNIGYAVGRDGTCLKTINAGISWTAIDLGLACDLKKIVFMNSQLGYMYGRVGDDSSTFYRTTNGGDSWELLFTTYSSNNDFNNMFFLSDSVGWLASSEKYYSTENYGEDWSATEMANSNDILDIEFINRDTGFIARNNALLGSLRTIDGGANWLTAQNTFIIDIEFPSKDNGYSLNGGGSGIFRTTDQGATWTDAYFGIPTSMEAISFINDSTGFCWDIGSRGRIYRTDNYGTNWGVVYENPLADINSIEISPSNKIFAVGKGAIILGSNDGLLWDTLHIGMVNGTLNRIVFSNDQNGYAVGDNGTILKTTDAALNWRKIAINASNNFGGLDFVNDDLGFIVGDNSSLFKTIDAGEHWVKSNTGISGEGRQIDMVDAQNGYVAADLKKTTDGGDSWSQTSENFSAFSMQCIGMDTVITSLNPFSTMRYTYDGGITWAEHSVNKPFLALYFFNSKRGFIGDTWGRVYKTTDGGQNFTRKHNCKIQINDLKFISDSIGYFVANNGYIGKTTDAGETWFRVESGTIRNLKSIFFTPDGTGYIVGADGIVMRKALVATYSLSFDVKDDYGNPITGVTLTVNGVSYPTGINSVVGLVEGDYTYIISKEGYVSQSDLVHITSDTLIPVVMPADLQAPIALTAKNINENEFTSNWEAVSEADTYLLFVSVDNFSSHISGYNGLELSGTSQLINGLELGQTYQYKLKSKNVFGYSNYSNTISVATVKTSVLKNNKELIVNVYPNPASEQVIIVIGNKRLNSISLLDLQGRILLTLNVSLNAGESFSLDISTIKRGLYIVKLRSDDGIFSYSNLVIE